VDDPLLYFAAVRRSNDPCEDHCIGHLTWCGAEGNRTPDLLDANETRYQLRYSPPRCRVSLAALRRLLPDRTTVGRLEGRPQLVEHRVLVIDVQRDGGGVGGGRRRSSRPRR
jgi:hypothetical protein